MKNASHYIITEKGIQCRLCPFFCVITEGKTGRCGVRKVAGGKLISLNYNKTSAINIDPIEKKPLYHFHPGQQILSYGSFGCNFTCENCQNWEIAQCTFNHFKMAGAVSPGQLANKAVQIENNIGVAYTYNEPTVYFEFMLETARLVHHKGLKNVMVSNGYICQEPLSELCNYIDAFNIDVKCFSETYYKQQLSAWLKPVLQTLEKIHKKGKHVEITCLIIPGYTDNTATFKTFVAWVKNTLGANTVLHISRYFPRFKLQAPQTGFGKLKELQQIAREALHYVYLGNTHEHSDNNTYCPFCNTLLIKRNGFNTSVMGLDSNGACSCGHQVAGKH